MWQNNTIRNYCKTQIFEKKIKLFSYVPARDLNERQPADVVSGWVETTPPPHLLVVLPTPPPPRAAGQPGQPRTQVIGKGKTFSCSPTVEVWTLVVSSIDPRHYNATTVQARGHSPCARLRHHAPAGPEDHQEERQRAEQGPGRQLLLWEPAAPGSLRRRLQEDVQGEHHSPRPGVHSPAHAGAARWTDLAGSVRDVVSLLTSIALPVSKLCFPASQQHFHLRLLLQLPVLTASPGVGHEESDLADVPQSLPHTRHNPSSGDPPPCLYELPEFIPLLASCLGSDALPGHLYSISHGLLPVRIWPVLPCDSTLSWRGGGCLGRYCGVAIMLRLHILLLKLCKSFMNSPKYTVLQAQLHVHYDLKNVKKGFPIFLN